MDNLCHALAAVSFGEAGLKRLTPWANASLVLSANIPDVDFVAVFGETPHVLYRRGWSHGILAQALWPVLITGLVVAADRFWARRTGRGPRVRPWAVLALCYLGVLSHVFLDFMNIYGIRLLKPLSERWFYGDALFIIDPWLWLILGLGVFLSRRFRQAAPAAVDQPRPGHAARVKIDRHGDGAIREHQRAVQGVAALAQGRHPSGPVLGLSRRGAPDLEPN